MIMVFRCPDCGRTMDVTDPIDLARPCECGGELRATGAQANKKPMKVLRPTDLQESSLMGAAWSGQQGEAKPVTKQELDELDKILNASTRRTP